MAAGGDGMTVPSDEYGDLIVTADTIRTTDDVKEVVAWLNKTTDWEAAHVAEDALYVAVLNGIAEGCASAWATEMAQAALVANTPDRVRWYA